MIVPVSRGADVLGRNDGSQNRHHMPGVIIVGAGPIGLVLAMDLAWHGVPSVVLERRDAQDPAHPKCNTTSARTMEILRRLGCADDYRCCGLPADYPNDVVYSTRVSGGHELGRLGLPAWSERWSADRFAFDGGWPSAERPHRASQMFLERVLRAHAARRDLIDLRFEHEVTGLVQGQGVVELAVRDHGAGVASSWTAPFVVGSDGGHSTVRHLLGVPMVGGTAAQANVWAIFLRCPELLARGPQPRAWMNWVNGSKARGMVCAINGVDTWLVHCTVPAGQGHDDFDWRRGVCDLLGFEAEFEVLAAERWRLSRAVAEKYRVGNVFLAGDAAHSWPPFAGFGMNSGVEDAVGLGWMLAAVLQGWADETVLDGYEPERKRVGEQVSRVVEGMVLAQREILNHPDHRDKLEFDNALGEAARDYVGRMLVAVDSQQFNPIGLNFGLCYDRSPIILYDDGVPPEFGVRYYTPSTAPGCRAPYFVMADGRPFYDVLGAGFTLLRTDPTLDITSFALDAKRRGIPLLLLDIGHEPKAAALYDHKLVMVRPDQRVVWRGDAVPDDTDAVLATLTGGGSREGRGNTNEKRNLG